MTSLPLASVVTNVSLVLGKKVNMLVVYAGSRTPAYTTHAII